MGRAPETGVSEEFVADLLDVAESYSVRLMTYSFVDPDLAALVNPGAPHRAPGTTPLSSGACGAAPLACGRG